MDGGKRERQTTECVAWLVVVEVWTRGCGSVVWFGLVIGVTKEKILGGKEL